MAILFSDFVARNINPEFILMHKSLKRGGSKKVSCDIRLAKLAFFRYNVAYLRKKSLPITRNPTHFTPLVLLVSGFFK